MNLRERKEVIVKQVFEGFELLGYETRNKYSIQTIEGSSIGYAAEQQKGVFNFLFRQFLGHFRKFDIHFFNNQKEETFMAHHPFRWYFQRLEINTPSGEKVGVLEKRFSMLSKKFDVQDSNGRVILEMRSPIWKFWTFPFFYKNQEVARVEKKWTGLLAESFTDKDTFLVKFNKEDLSESERQVILATSVFIDLQFFEKKAD